MSCCNQEEKMDFQALRARFQENDNLLKQPRVKPVLPEKPKGLPPPPPISTQTTPHFLPAGARPSLLSSLNQSLDGKSAMAPRVVFKEEKKQSKKPLLSTSTKKEKSDTKLKKKEKEKEKDKGSKGNKEKVYEEQVDPKPKKENGKDKKFHIGTSKESTTELVPAATPPPKTATPKKSFLGFKKPKRDSAEILADPILDMPSSDVSGTLPLIPVPLDASDIETPALPKALLPNIQPLPEVVTPAVSASPDGAPPLAFIPDTPAPQISTLESVTPHLTETPALLDSPPTSQTEFIPDPPAVAPTPPPFHMMPSSPSPLPASSPSPTEPEFPSMENILEVLPPPVLEPPTIPSSPKAARPISALSALERAEDMSPSRKTHPCDARIFNALEKARKKTSG